MTGESTESSGSSSRKKVDESWKDSVAKEKAQTGAETAQPDAQTESPAESEFSYFLSTLGMQAMVALGQIQDPMTGGANVNLQQAKYLIDTLQMLSDKTKGNLNASEASMLKDLLYQLRMHFVKLAQTSGE